MKIIFPYPQIKLDGKSRNNAQNCTTKCTRLYSFTLVFSYTFSSFVTHLKIKALFNSCHEAFDARKNSSTSSKD